MNTVLAGDDESMAVAQWERVEQDGDFIVLKYRPSLPLARQHRASPAWFPKICSCHDLNLAKAAR